MDGLKKITPEEQNTDTEPEITLEAKDAGFHEFPGTTKGGFSFPKFNFSGRSLGKAGIVAAVVIILLVIFGVLPAIGIYRSAKKLEASGGEFYAATQSKNLERMKDSLKKVKEDISAFDRSLGGLAWVKFVPFLGGYWNDAHSAAKGGVAGVEAGEIILNTAGPYADVLGLDGGKPAATDGGKRAEDRIDFIVETIDDIIPQLDPIGEKTKIMAEELNSIDPNRYPETFRGRPLRSQIKSGIETINSLNEFIWQGRPVLEQAPYLLGIGQDRTYLFLWQNDKELRPTGGFITAYSIVRVRDGKFQPVTSNDIYNLDNRLNSRIPAPEPIKKYLPLVHYWNLRDMNLSPDLKVSMDTFMENYAKTRSPEVDGIVTMDTKLVVDLLKVIGRIGVPGYGNFSAEDDPRCNCPVVIYELESFADVAGPIVWDPVSGEIVYKPPHADNRKEILGPLMNSILANSLAQPKDKIGGIFEAGFNALREKHIMFYFGEGKVQEAMESFNLAGRIRDYDGDYLHINDSNFAGAKSNLYVQQEVNLKITPGKDGGNNKLSIKYKNPQPHDGWLNGIYRDWVRIYVPKGSKLVSSTGSDVEIVTTEDLGKTVFEGFFTLRPEGVTELSFEYQTPVKQSGDYKLLIQKQPGTDGNLYMVEVGRKKEEFNLKTDKELRF